MNDPIVLTLTEARWWAPEPEREPTEAERLIFARHMQDRLDALAWALVMRPTPPPVIEPEPFKWEFNWRYSYGMDWASRSSLYVSLDTIMGEAVSQIAALEGWAIIQQSMARLMLAEWQKPEHPPTVA